MKAAIVRAEETVELSPTGELIRIAVYRFTLDALGPFEVRLPLTEDTEENLRTAIERKEKMLTNFVK
jgi:hypothetical protein